jgi:transcriptional regulator of PTS gene
MKEKHTNRGSNNQNTRIRNRALVLRLICTQQDASRVSIAKQTGLSKMSVTNIVNELIQEGFVKEHTCDLSNGGKPSTGRKPVLLVPDCETHAVIGVYISRDSAVAILSNLKCEILYEVKLSFTFEESNTSFIQKILELTGKVIGTGKAKGKKILGIGISCIGPLDRNSGLILQPPNFYHLRSIPIRQKLEEKFGYPVYVDNDMNASALAEKLYGNGKNISNFVYIGVTNGIGSGIISNDALYAGEMGFGGEIGHTTINFEGPKCACGNTGCLELYASIPEIVKLAGNSVELGMSSSLKYLDKIQWEDIVRCAMEKDTLALNLIERMCMYISIGLVSIINLFDPSTIFLGHDIAIAGSMVTDKLESYIKDRAISSRYKNVPIEISAFGVKAPVAGSAALVLNQLFAG